MPGGRSDITGLKILKELRLDKTGRGVACRERPEEIILDTLIMEKIGSFASSISLKQGIHN
jgi:hypothetical protein